MIQFECHPDGVIIPIKAHAAARKNAVGGEHDGMLKVSVTQASENGKANKAIIALLAKQLKIPKSRFELIAGETNPRKRILVHGVETGTLERLLDD